MTETVTEESTQSFTEYADHRQASNRSVAVYVEGVLNNDPPLGNAGAMRIAHYLAGDKDVLRMQPGEVTNEDGQQPESVGAVVVRLLPNSSKDEWQPVQRRLLSRVPQDTDIVVLVDHSEIPWFCKELCDVRVVVDGIDKTLQFYRVKLNPYSGDVYYHEMNGFHGDDNDD